MCPHLLGPQSSRETDQWQLKVSEPGRHRGSWLRRRSQRRALPWGEVGLGTFWRKGNPNQSNLSLAFIPFQKSQ